MGKSSRDKEKRGRLRRKHACFEYFGYDAAHIPEATNVPYDHPFVALRDQIG